jgi:hypothetical protein
VSFLAPPGCSCPAAAAVAALTQVADFVQHGFLNVAKVLHL